MIDTCLYLNVRRLERKLSTLLDSEFKEININPSSAYIIQTVSMSGHTKIKHISKNLGLSSSTVTRMVLKLEKEGYLKKGSETSPCDISLTKKGSDILPEIHNSWNRFNSLIETTFTDDEIAILNKEIILSLNKLDDK